MWMEGSEANCIERIFGRIPQPRKKHIFLPQPRKTCIFLCCHWRSFTVRDSNSNIKIYLKVVLYRSKPWNVFLNLGETRATREQLTHTRNSIQETIFK